MSDIAHRLLTSIKQRLKNDFWYTLDFSFFVEVASMSTLVLAKLLCLHTLPLLIPLIGGATSASTVDGERPLA